MAGLGVAACGDDDDSEPTLSTSTVTTSVLTAPSTTTTQSTTETTPTQSTTTTETLPTEPDNGSGGVSPDQSGEDAFDEFCDANPEACE